MNLSKISAVLTTNSKTTIGLNRYQLPELPRVYVDTTYTLPTGGITWTATTSGNTAGSGGSGQTGCGFQYALDNCSLGDVIVLSAGVTYVGPYAIPNKSSGLGWVYVISSALGSLPAAGTRVTAGDATNMAKITVTGAATSAAITTVAGSHHFRFVGIEICPASNSDFVYNMISTSNSDTSNSTVSHHIIFDRCYIHGCLAPTNPVMAGRRGLFLTGEHIAVIDCRITQFFENGADSQCVFIYQGSGPFKIHNNYCEAASENLLIGGSDPTIRGSIPSDVVFSHNYCFKPLSWIGATLNVKNLIEFKLGRRVLVEGNTFENNWADGQTGFAFLITPRNQDGTSPWAVTEDITFRLNKMLNVGAGINISGRDSNTALGGIYKSQITRRILIENNFFNVTGIQSSDNRVYQTLGGPENVTIRHNTAIMDIALTYGACHVASNVPQADNFIFENNILDWGYYGFIGDSTSGINNTYASWYRSNCTCTNNVFIAGSGTGAPASNNFFPANRTAVGFTNFAGGDYTLTGASIYHNAATDGTDPGADWTALNAATA